MEEEATVITTVCPVCESRLQYRAQLKRKKYQETPFVFVCTNTVCGKQFACSSRGGPGQGNYHVITYLTLPQCPSEEERPKTPLEKLARKLVETRRVLRENDFCERAFPQEWQPDPKKGPLSLVCFDGERFKCSGTTDSQKRDLGPLPACLATVQLELGGYYYFGPPNRIAEIARRVQQIKALQEEIQEIINF